MSSRPVSRDIIAEVGACVFFMFNLSTVAVLVFSRAGFNEWIRIAPIFLIFLVIGILCLYVAVSTRLEWNSLHGHRNKNSKCDVDEDNDGV